MSQTLFTSTRFMDMHRVSKTLSFSIHTLGSANRQGGSIQQTTDIVMKENVCFKPLVQTWLVEKKKIPYFLVRVSPLTTERNPDFFNVHSALLFLCKIKVFSVRITLRIHIFCKFSCSYHSFIRHSYSLYFITVN